MKLKKLYIICLLPIFLYGCLPPRALFLGKPDEKDIARFNSAIIHSGNECFEFKKEEPLSGKKIKIDDWTKDIPFFLPLDTFAQSHKIRSLLIIQNDTIKYEYNSGNDNDKTVHSSYSIAKSFTATLIGIAIEEGHIKSEKDVVIKYIPELKNVPYAEQLTIEHLLNHSSGIKYNLAMDATIYYGRNTLKALNKNKFERIPGTKQHYLNINS